MIITLNKYKVQEAGSKLSFDQDMEITINDETFTNLDITKINVTPGEFKEVRYALFLVPENASKLISFDKDEKTTFVMFITNDNEIVGNEAYCITDTDNWIELGLW